MRNRALAIIGWVVFVAVAMVLGSVAGQQQMTADEYAQGDSARAVKILDDAGLTPAAGELVLVTSGSGPITSPALRSTVGGLIKKLSATGVVTAIRDPYASGLISADKQSVLLQLTMTGDPVTAAERVQPVVDVVDATRTANPGLRIDEFGDGTANQWFNDSVGKDFQRAEWTAVPLALGILLVAFGALLAAVLPVGLALMSFLAANGLLAVVSHRLHLDTSTSSVMLLVGLAVGVDYCMFYLRREREERARGADPATALRIAAATSGRSVLISGLTFIVAMSGMFLSGMLLFDGFAVAAILVVLVAVIGSLTVLPAVLSVLGDHVDFGRIPGLERMRRPQNGSRIWGAILDRVLRRPGLSVVAAGAFLLVLAAPVLGIRTEKLSLDKQLPASSSIMQSYQRITAAFPGGPSPATIVVQAPDVTSSAVTAAISDLKARALAGGIAREPIQVTVHPTVNVIVVSVPLAGNGTDTTSTNALDALRHDVVPAAFSPLADTQVYVGGNLAFSQDFNAQMQKAIVPVIAFVMILAFLLMLVAFRSITIAAISVLLNVLSMSAAFGVMVAIFQHGWGASLVGAEPVGAIESWIPLFCFVILFGLSMDYHVFVVSRIREAHDRGLPTQDAIAHGIKISAGVVTSAAAIMVGVFAIFGTLSLTAFKQLGVGLAVAILLDATIVRAVLLPSLLSLLGERTWWLPRWLSFLPEAAPVESSTPQGAQLVDLTEPAAMATVGAGDSAPSVAGPPPTAVSGNEGKA